MAINYLLMLNVLLDSSAQPIYTIHLTKSNCCPLLRPQWKIIFEETGLFLRCCINIKHTVFDWTVFFLLSVLWGGFFSTVFTPNAVAHIVIVFSRFPSIKISEWIALEWRNELIRVRFSEEYAWKPAAHEMTGRETGFHVNQIESKANK